MIAAQQIQERRLDELLKRQLGPRILAAISDPEVTEIIVNEDGRLWLESYGTGLRPAEVVLPATQVESLICRTRATPDVNSNTRPGPPRTPCEPRDEPPGQFVTLVPL